MPQKTNILFILADQLRAAALPLYGETQIETPNLDRLASDGMTLTNMIATCPVCTPYRAMLLTGRHPQTTGHIHNSIRTRHTEISIADAFADQGYRTGWIGKWHLHTGVWPAQNVPDWVPEGRDRLGFQFWRAYNMHMVYFNGFVNTSDWNYERWEGYETEGLLRYAFEFLDDVGDDPFCLFLSPHQPHFTPFQFAPEHYYARLPNALKLPKNVPEDIYPEAAEMYRHYLAMTMALDDMVGALVDYLERTGRAEDTLVVFTSDHGSQVGAQGLGPWLKKQPYRESLDVPFIARLPGVLEGGAKRDALTSPVDLFPSLCSLCGIPVPRSVEGYDLSPAWRGNPGAFEQDAVLTMNFSSRYDWIGGGAEWRGVRTQRHNYARWLSGEEALFDLEADPLEMTNLAGKPEYADLHDVMTEQLVELQKLRGDQLLPCEDYRPWYDAQRRVVRNAFGPLSDPEGSPDWSLLR
ncbi:MAG: sulfatase family protein [Anaerolineae bacterium]